MFAIALILGSFVATYLTDKLGRKFLNFISLVGAAIGMYALATYQYVRMHGIDLSAYAWIPVACLSFIIFISSAGITPLSVVCSLECMPPKVCYNMIRFYETKHYNELKILFLDSNIWNGNG